MPSSEYDPTLLAQPTDKDGHSPTSHRSASPFWSRERSFRRPHSSRQRASSGPKQSLYKRLQKEAYKQARYAITQYNGLTTLQKVLLIAFIIVSSLSTILFWVYNKPIFAFMIDVSKKWRAIPGGWAIIWILEFVVAMPPLIGYSTLLSVAGFVYGFPLAWPLVASANIAGSAVAFLLCRRFFSNFTENLVKKDPRFAALALTVKHDGLKLLCMIRFAPLPYSLSNGACASIPTVSWSQFVLATALVSPKLLIHIFISSKLADIADHGGEMDLKTKIISYVSIGLGGLVGMSTGWIIYRQTTKRARELEEQEAEAALGEQGDERRRREYEDNPAAREAAALMRDEGDDSISLRDPDEWNYDFDEDDDANGDHQGSAKSNGKHLDIEAGGSSYRDVSPGPPR